MYDERVDVWAFAITIHDWLLAGRFGMGPCFGIVRGLDDVVLEQLREWDEQPAKLIERLNDVEGCIKRR